MALWDYEQKIQVAVLNVTHGGLNPDMGEGCEIVESIVAIVAIVTLRKAWQSLRSWRLVSWLDNDNVYLINN